MIDCWENKKVTVGLEFEGDFPDGSLCTVVFYQSKGAFRGRDVLATKKVKVQGNAATVEWITSLVPDDKMNMRVHYQATVDGQRGSASSDSGDLRVWVKKIKVLGKNVDDGDKLFEGAEFLVEMPGAPQWQRPGGEEDGPKKFHLDEGDDEGLEVELEDFVEPRITWVRPYELVAWEQNQGRKRVARVRRPPFRAVFRQKPEDGAPPGCNATRKQYVNLPASDALKDLGHQVVIWVGSDQEDIEDEEVFIQVKFSGPKDGKPSKRKTPLPTLVGGVGSDEWTYKFEGGDEKRFLTFKSKANLATRHEQGGSYAAFSLELGLAGGDVCEVKIGSTAACADGTLKITNWRRVGYANFFPDTDLSDFGTYTKGKEKAFSDKVMVKTQKECAKCFVEYYRVDEFPFGEDVWEGMSAVLVHDAKKFGGKAGKKVFAIDSERAELLAKKLKEWLATTGQDLLPNEHPNVVVDYLMDKDKNGGEFTTGPIKSWAEAQALKDKELTLHDAKSYVMPRRFALERKRVEGVEVTNYVEGASVRALSAHMIKGKGKADRTAVMGLLKTLPRKKEDRSPDQATLFQWASGYLLWSESTASDQQLASQDQFIEFVSTSKIKLKFPDDSPVMVSLKALFTSVPDAEVTFTVRYEKLKDAAAVGMAIGDGVLVYPTFGGKASDGDVHTTIVHELAHAIGHAYGKKDADNLPLYGPAVIPGLDFRKRLKNGGYVYEGHGHTGGHCAMGLASGDDQDSTHKDIDFSESNRIILKAKCLNFGQGTLTAQPLCAECAEAMSASDVSALH
jgi:hypothetical protein